MTHEVFHNILYGCETWGKHSLRLLANNVVRRIIWPKRDELTGEWKKYIMSSSMICTAHQIFFG
jgi:hypothetical protein